MASAPLTRETYLPEAGEQLARVYDFLTAREATGATAPEPRYMLAGAGAGEQVELPHEVYRVLLQVVEAMQANLAVTVVPQAMTLTTQQAADLLGVSRPTVVKLLDEDKIPFERVGTHRRILLRDLLSYRKRRRDEQYAALDAMSAEIDDDTEDPETLQRRLRAARAAVAARRNSSTA